MDSTLRTPATEGSPIPASHPVYLPHVDGLRAIAVVAVVIFHAFPPLLPGGFIGVDIFFVISGYLITGILLNDIRQQRFSIQRFYRKRILRIFPALLAVLASVLLFGWFVLFNPEFRQLGLHILSAGGFVQNLTLWHESGYFDNASIAKPLLHLWSLAIEEQFYIVWPLLLVMVGLRIRALFLLLLCSGLGSMLLGIYYVCSDSTAAYYSPLGRAWELLVGAALASIQHHRSARLQYWQQQRGLANGAVLLGLLLIGGALAMLNRDSAFPGYWALLPTLGAALLIVFGQHSHIGRLLLSQPSMVYLGLISYPLYLWHWPLLSFGRIIKPFHGNKLTLLLLALAALLAVLTYHLLERPLRRQVQQHGSRRPLQCLLTTMVALVCLGALSYQHTLSPRLQQVLVPERNEWDFLRTTVSHFDNTGIGIYRLPGQSADTVLYLGDSQLAQYAERIHRVQSTQPNSLSAIFAVGGGCIPVSQVFIDELNRQGCWELRRQAFAMASDPAIKRVVIGGAWHWYLLNSPYYLQQQGSRINVSTDAGRLAALSQLGQDIRHFRELGKEVYLVLGNPISQELSPFTSGVRLLPANRSATQPLLPIDTAQQQLHQALLEVAEQFGARIIDPYEATCPGNRCPRVTITGLPIFKDHAHFNPDWAVNNAQFMDSSVLSSPALRFSSSL
ncbi:acyltransferase family protein [Pokkaliibacter sp. MBI-7]|uniref:acyltransferase family protein n=1 Tax=Pokkaliibacter sp. MBI-7 TaxID=3040600 RepID=UPI00244A4644|nr:acyltransferase family protein [Pokkaliibacter sp. MBI-7]MDH2432994.1 acyltransferase family protein [Pokkaliibacter sp. MBI-7]